MNSFIKFIKGSKPTKEVLYEDHPKIMDEMAAFLESRGHSCVGIVGTSNHKFEWCMKDDCPKTQIWDNMHKRAKDVENEIQRLKKDGHTCISIMESYPPQISWCNCDPCANKNN